MVERCFACGKDLVSIEGKGVIFATYIDPLGHSHKMHKNCFKHDEYSTKPVTACPQGEPDGRGGYFTVKSES